MRPQCWKVGLTFAAAISGPAAADADASRESLLRTVQFNAPDRQDHPRSRPELKSLSDFGHAIYSCWRPPNRSEAPHDIMITVKLSFTRQGEVFGKPVVTYITPGTAPEHEFAYRRAVANTFLRCTPLRLNKGLGNAIAGRPFSFSFGSERGRNSAERAGPFGVAMVPDMPSRVAQRRPI